MTQASEIFVCTQQPNGQFTLNNSPDIFCYGDASNGGWNYMLPATIIIYLCFGLGSLLFFIYVFIEKKRLMYGEKKIIKMREEVEETSAMIKKENNIVGDVELEELHDLEFGQELFVKVNKLEKYQKRIQNANKNFKERYRFLLLRFKRKLFYWEAVITARKLALSLLYTFLKPVQVVVFGIMVVFLALILHFNFVPFRQVREVFNIANVFRNSII
jgi:ABC-type sugar transport system permease subunit